MSKERQTASDNPAELTTMVFDNEEEYVRFTEYVYESFGGKGLEFTNVPVITSVRLTRELFEQTKDLFSMRNVTEEDLLRAKRRVEGHAPFDPETIRGLHVPGLRA